MFHKSQSSYSTKVVVCNLNINGHRFCFDRPLRSTRLYRIRWCSLTGHRLSSWIVNQLSVISVVLGQITIATLLVLLFDITRKLGATNLSYHDKPRNLSIGILLCQDKPRTAGLESHHESTRPLIDEFIDWQFCFNITRFGLNTTLSWHNTTATWSFLFSYNCNYKARNPKPNLRVPKGNR